MIDKHGRTIDYLRISLTDLCNLRCLYCMPADGVKQMAHDEILRFEEFERIVRVAAEMGVRSVRLTGGEPLVRRGIEGFVERLAAVAGIEDIALTTNGTLLAAKAAALKDAGLSRVNISLDSLDPDQYRFITRCGSLEQVLAGVDAALDVGLHPVKLNAVVVRRLHQDYYAFSRMSVDRPLHVRFIEYMPVGESGGENGGGWDCGDLVSSREVLEEINRTAAAEGLAGLEPAQAEETPFGSGPARYYRFPGAQGTVGFISPLSNHFCSQCNRLRLTADGRLRACLFSDIEYDMRFAVRQGGEDAIREVFARALAEKPDAHHGKKGTKRKMNAIGG